jgi:hypothetical protein
MNQKVVIYIILSTVLLYLYYRNRDLTIFAAFVVLVFATLVFGDAREGMKGSGKSGGECKSLGFTVPKIDKNDKKDKEKQSSKSSCTDDISSSNASAAYRESKKNDDFSDKEVNDTTTPKQRSPMENKAHYRQRALKDYKDLYESAKVVKNMLFVDVHGDAGRYTGDVNEFRMPHGQGNIIYEHGLVQGGKWVSTSLMICDYISN